MVTGLPLTANDPATAVLLTRAGDGYRPAALGVQGIYNCYGTVDAVREDVNAGLIWAYVTERLADGRLVVGAGESLEPTDTVDELLEVVERNQEVFLHDGHEDQAEFEPALALDGAMIHHALIYQPVWDALTAPDHGTVDELFRRILGESAIAGEIYRARLADVAAQVRQLAGVNDFLVGRGLRWAPPGEARQRYPTDLGGQYDTAVLRRFVEEARRDTADVEALRAAIDEADRRVAEREEEARWQERSRDGTARRTADGSPTDPSTAVLAALTSVEVKWAVAVDENGDTIG
ncbi:hypothetical protein WEI85_42715 [Actinomycetes bacterium KLBMP 9797]